MPIDNSKSIAELLQDATADELKIVAGAVTPYVEGKNPPQVLIIDKIIFENVGTNLVRRSVLNTELISILVKYNIIEVSNIGDIIGIHQDIGDINSIKGVRIRYNSGGLLDESIRIRYISPSETAMQKQKKMEDSFNSKVPTGSRRYSGSPFDGIISTYLYKLWDKNAEDLNTKIKNGYSDSSFLERYVGYFNDKGEFIPTGGVQYVEKNTDATEEEYDRAKDVYDQTGNPVLYEAQYGPYTPPCIGENCVDFNEIDETKNENTRYGEFGGVNTDDITALIGSSATKTPLDSKEYRDAVMDRRSVSPIAEMIALANYQANVIGELSEIKNQFPSTSFDSNGNFDPSKLDLNDSKNVLSLNLFYEKAKKANPIAIKLTNALAAYGDVTPLFDPSLFGKKAGEWKKYLVQGRKTINFGIEQIIGSIEILDGISSGDSEKVKYGGKIISKGLYNEYIVIPGITALCNTIGTEGSRFIYRTTPTIIGSNKLAGRLGQKTINDLGLGNPIGIAASGNEVLGQWSPTTPGLGIDISDLNGYTKYAAQYEADAIAAAEAAAAGRSVNINTTLSVTRGERALLQLRSRMASRISTPLQLILYIILYGPDLFGYTPDAELSELEQIEIGNAATGAGVNKEFAKKTDGKGILPGYGFDPGLLSRPGGLMSTVKGTTIEQADGNKSEGLTVGGTRGQKYWMVRTPNGNATKILIPFGLVGEVSSNKDVFEQVTYLRSWEEMSGFDKAVYWIQDNLTAPIKKVTDLYEIGGWILKKAFELFVPDKPKNEVLFNEDESNDLHGTTTGDKDLNGHTSLMLQIEASKSEYRTYERIVNELYDEGRQLELGTSSVPNIPLDDINEEVSYVTNINELTNPFFGNNSIELSNQIWNPSGCFPEYTTIKTPFGQTRISDLKIGDIVLSFDVNKKINNNKIVNLFRFENKKIYRYHLENGDQIDVTETHPFLTINDEFVPIYLFKIGDYLVNEKMNPIKIVDINELGYNVVYNIEVENDHTYFANNISVHNKTAINPNSYSGARNNLSEILTGIEEEGERIRRNHEEWIETNFPGTLSFGFPWKETIKYPDSPPPRKLSDEERNGQRIRDLVSNYRRRYGNTITSREADISVGKSVRNYIFDDDTFESFYFYDKSPTGQSVPTKIPKTLWNPKKR